MKRVIIETSDTTRMALDRVLMEKGQTLTDWFNDKVDEAVREPTFYSSNGDLELKSLDELRDSEAVLKTLSSYDWSFTDDDTSYLSHSIHPYPAKYIPQIPNLIIRLLSMKGEKVWDPFGGSGTTALEALLLKRKALSSDINPIASTIGRAKTKTLTGSEDKELIGLILKINILLKNENLTSVLKKNKENISKYVPEIFNREKWFHPTVINELAYLRYIISEGLSDGSAAVAMAVFSKIIVKVSFQDSETRYVSKKREILAGSTLKIFVSELESILIKLRKLAPLLNFREAEFIHANLVKENVTSDNSIDLIVTSPPYPNATDYHLYHKFRITWLGYDHKDMANNEVGSHLRHQRDNSEIEVYLFEMNCCLKQMYSALRAGRFAVLVIGDSLFKGENYDTASLVNDEAKKLGFESVGIITRKLHTTKRSFGPTARRLREEKLLVIRKPEVDITFALQLPTYKLWPYEEIIRKEEIRCLFGSELKNASKNMDEITIGSLASDKLKKLTFTKSFSSECSNSEKTWQSILENGDTNSPQLNRKDPKYITHGIHAYKGKFYPQLAKSLFNLANIKIGSHLVDPFCGSGTVLLEGALNGYRCSGFDLNPIALKIAKVKSDIIHSNPFVITQLIEQFLGSLKSVHLAYDYKKAFEESVLEELCSWFPEKVLNKLAGILRLINDIPDPIVAEFLEVCVSSIVRDISQQDSMDLRIRRRKDPISDAPVIELLTRKIEDQLTRLKSFFIKARYSPYDFPHSEVWEGDSRLINSFTNAGIKVNSVDAVVTSPPYATALPYIDTDRLSILLLFGLRNKDSGEIEKKLIGSRDVTKRDRDFIEDLIDKNDFGNIRSNVAQKIIKRIHHENKHGDSGFRKKNMASLVYRYYKDMSMVFANLHQIVRPNGSMFFVIGDNRTEANGHEIIIKSGKCCTYVVP